jgi:hypothetical protein
VLCSDLSGAAYETMMGQSWGGLKRPRTQWA